MLTFSSLQEPEIDDGVWTLGTRRTSNAKAGQRDPLKPEVLVWETDEIKKNISVFSADGKTQKCFINENDYYVRFRITAVTPSGVMGYNYRRKRLEFL